MPTKSKKKRMGVAGVPTTPTISSTQLAIGSRVVTFSDTVDLSPWARGVFCAAAGDVCFVGADGATDTITVPAATYLPIVMKRVKVAGTTVAAGSIHAYK